MDDILIYAATSTDAGTHAVRLLAQAGIPITRTPTSDTTHLMLDVPSFRQDRLLRNGEELAKVLQPLPKGVRIIGGNLAGTDTEGRPTLDLLADEDYTAENAAITGECAVRIAAPLLKVTFRNASVLVIGWGRIGKCLAQLLRDMGCRVTVAARNRSHRALLKAMGFMAIDTAALGALSPYQLIYNTVPERMLAQEDCEGWGSGIKIDLASRQGLIGSDVIWARGLPGRCAPESSGRLIADTVLHYLKEE